MLEMFNFCKDTNTFAVFKLLSAFLATQARKAKTFLT